MFKNTEDSIFIKVLAIVLGIGYVFIVSLFGFIAQSHFQDRRFLKAGTIVQGTIVSVRGGKTMASGTIAYRLPDGIDCLDWTELGPNSEVHPGEQLAVAVSGSCGHPVSTKKRLNPWAYLLMCIGGILYPLFIMARTFLRSKSMPATSQSR